MLNRSLQTLMLAVVLSVAATAAAQKIEEPKITNKEWITVPAIPHCR